VEVHIEASGPVKPVAKVLADPERIVVDLAGLGCDGRRRLPVNAQDVEAVRVALYQANPPVTRVVVDLSHPHEYRLLPAGSTVILAIETTPTAATVRQPGLAKMAAVAASNATAPQSAPAARARSEAPTPSPESAPLQVTQPVAPTIPTTPPEVASIESGYDPPMLSGIAETTPHQAAKASKPGVVRRISVSREKGAIEVHIEGSKPLRAWASTLGHPERIIIDLADVRLLRPWRIPVNGADVQAVSASLYLVNPLTTRVVVDLARGRHYHLWTSGNSLTVRIDTDEVKAASVPPA
jgi:AMIN domain